MIAKSSREVESAIDTTVSVDTSASLLDPGAFLLVLGLVILGQIDGHTAAREHSSRVAGICHNNLCLADQADTGGGAGILARGVAGAGKEDL